MEEALLCCFIRFYLCCQTKKEEILDENRSGWYKCLVGLGVKSHRAAPLVLHFKVCFQVLQVNITPKSPSKLLVVELYCAECKMK